MKDRIRKLRKALGVTLNDFARALEVSPPAVSSWEQGRNGVPGSIRQLICYTFHVSRKWLDTGKGAIFISNKSPEELNQEAFHTVALELYAALPPYYQERVLEIASSIVEQGVLQDEDDEDDEESAGICADEEFDEFDDEIEEEVDDEEPAPPPPLPKRKRGRPPKNTPLLDALDDDE